MSWKANMHQEFTYFPKPYPIGPAPRNSTMVSGGNTRFRKPFGYHPKIEPSHQPWNNLSVTTTMTGLPLAVRAKLEGKFEEPPPRSSSPPARLANYTFTYGLSKEDEEQIRAEVPSGLGLPFQVSPGSEASQFGIGHRTQSNASTVISGRLKAIKESFHKAEDLPNQPKPYFRNWGNSKSATLEAAKKLDLDDSESILHSTQNILNDAGFHEGLSSYFDGLDEMDALENSDDELEETLPMIEPEKATAAFQPPEPKPSRLQPKTYYEVKPKGYESKTSLYRSHSTITAAASTVSKKPSKRVRLAEPNPALFIKPPPLKPSHQEKVIEKQLQREVAISPMTHEQYSARKKELLQAALQAYDREVPTYEAMPDIRDEVIAAEEQNKAVSRQNVMDLLYNALTNQSTTLTMKSPSTSLHLSTANFANRDKGPKSRPLDQFKGPVVSTILRELQEAKDAGELPSQNAANRFSKHTPDRRRSKEKLRALRTLENYDLSKLRQRSAMAPKPVLTLLSIKGEAQPNSRYSGVGGTPSSRPHQGFTEDVGTTTSGPGSFTALSNLQTRNEKYTQSIRARRGPARRTAARKPKPHLTVPSHRFRLNR